MSRPIRRQGERPGTGTDPAVAQDAQTIVDVLGQLERQGYGGQFRVQEGGRVQCLTCRRSSRAADVAIHLMTRLEGASDPADMLAVVGVDCPSCATKGTLVLNYGPGSTPEEAGVLVALEDRRPGPGTA